jgi:hypothetical protein
MLNLDWRFVPASNPLASATRVPGSHDRAPDLIGAGPT